MFQLLLPALLSIAPSTASSPAQEAETPQWIWFEEPAEDGQELWARYDFDFEAAPEKAHLRGSCDNRVRVYLDGEEIASSDEWTRPFEVDMSDGIGAGQHVLAAACANDGGPAGLWLDLELEWAGGETRHIVTGEAWRVRRDAPTGWNLTGFSAEGWIAATALAPLGGGLWAGILQEVPPDETLPAEEVTVPEGFVVELIYSVPKEEQGSWVVLTFDDRGRIITSDQYGSLYRMTPPPIGEADGNLEVETLEGLPGMAQGLLWAFDSLYVVVAEGGEHNGLYRIRDLDGDDHFDDVQLLQPLGWGGEHGPHAVIVDERGTGLYLIAGNHVPLPEGVVRYRPTRAWGEDQLLPRFPDPGGHANGITAPGGWVCHLDPDGGNWELVAMGLRNSYDLALDPSGELFTFDADMEWDVGLPWYRPTRICHLVSGADFGWRFGSGKWPAYYPDSLPAVVDMGQSSPTGIVFATQAAFHGDWRSKLLVADWAYGRIFAVSLEEEGAGFRGHSELFASGKPFPVTDLAIGPDGALYVTTGGRRTQSGLYRIHSTLPPGPMPGAGSVSSLRKARRVIERNHGLGVPTAYWSELGSQDPYLANAARVLLEQAPVQDWAARALAEADLRIALQALLALCRVAPQQYGKRILERLDRIPVGELSVPLALDYTRLYALTYIRAGAPSPQVAARQRALWEARFPSGTQELDFELARLLVYLGSPVVVERALALLEQAEAGGDQAAQIHYAYCLAFAESGWTFPLRRRYFRWLNRVAPTLSGGLSFEGYLQAIREVASEHLPPELAAHPDLLILPSGEAGEPLAPAPFVRAWSAEDLLPLLAQTRRGRNFERGRAAFRKATCAQCHRLQGEGGGIGPDLSGAGGRFSPRDLLESILEPSRTISDQYQEIEVITQDGLLYVGRIAGEDGERLTLWDGAGERIEIDKDSIAERRPHPLSRMPSGLLDVLDRDEILDLFAYTLSGGSPEDPAFH